MKWLLCIVFPAMLSTFALAEEQSLPALMTVANQYKTELSLSDEQTKKAHDLITGQMQKIEGLVDRFGGVSFDSVLDLMEQGRAIRDEFIPQLQNILTPEQKEKLKKMPKDAKLYQSLMSAWLAEARVKKLASRVHLTPDQIPKVREVLLNEFQDAADILQGLAKVGEEQDKKKAVLDGVLDLRGAIRNGQRNIQKLLTPEQQKAFDEYKKESQKNSEQTESSKQ